MSTGFHVGDKVKIPLGRRTVTGVISEAHGAIGVRGAVIAMDLAGIGSVAGWLRSKVSVSHCISCTSFVIGVEPRF